ncbi:hypothetical protein L3Y34_002932 [Caenorhabditis briggsae]|uniref:Uncharacterized protein n=1 Tax=Caenorhabditis briggsae TaxID=6238 RepID=A0AAE9A646_CAEBR|nr:hypothetical protein L3Y34_002932 [Caenorhabditis briggsae]
MMYISIGLVTDEEEIPIKKIERSQLNKLIKTIKQHLCAVGPKKNPSESNFQKGAPGSACPNGPNPVGLCKALNMGENGDGEDKGSNQSSLIALLLIVLLI